MASRKQRGDYDRKIAGLYDLEDTIGRGHFAVVKLARHVFTGEKVAVKVIDKSKLDEVSKNHLFQEVRCMKLVQHPNVVRLYEVIDTQTKLYLILELGDGGDLYDYIMKHDKGLNDSLARKYFKQIVDAISYCHQLHVCHRDLKPENVVFFEKLGIVKLTDFGFSNVFKPGKKLETSCGSLAYSAPEILLGDSYDAPAVDVWSLGVVLYMLVCGTPPFYEANDSETLTMIMDCKYKFPGHVSKDCQSLISSMLIREPNQRASLEQIMNHAWLKSGDVPYSNISVNIPLLSRSLVSADDHAYIVERMIEGRMATKEEIALSLEKDSYDHIAATYYLMIERRLKAKQAETSASTPVGKSANAYQIRKNSAPADGKPHLEPLALSPRSFGLNGIDSCYSKPILAKKTKTAPLEIGNGNSLPQNMGGHSPSDASAIYFKSLTISMTLDRKTSGKKNSVARDPYSKGSKAPLPPETIPNPVFCDTGGAPSSTEKAKKPFKLSKIAILSSLFEKKTTEKPKVSFEDKEKSKKPKFLKKITSGIQIKDDDPGNLKHSIVQTLVSPPGTLPSPSCRNPSSPQKTSFNRKCSLIKEELGDDDGAASGGSEEVEVKATRSVENLLESKKRSVASDPIYQMDSTSVRRALHSVASSPQLLNQISEERESDEEEEISVLPSSASKTLHRSMYSCRPNLTSAEMRKFEQHKKRRGTGQRGTSCSSSDASDTEETENIARKDKLKHKFATRRDSSDHSSDNDGPGGLSAPSGGSRSVGRSSSSNRGEGKQGSKSSDHQDKSSEKKGQKGSGGKSSRANTTTTSYRSCSDGNTSSSSSSGSSSSTKPQSCHLNGATGCCSQLIENLCETKQTGHNFSKLCLEDKQSLLEQDGKRAKPNNQKDLDVNLLNKLNSHIWEVKSRNNSDYKEIKQSAKITPDEILSMCSSDCNLHIRKGKRFGRRIKTDINRNGLKPSMCKLSSSSKTSHSIKLETKCCSLV
ncbi:serine/threonine-protein kinase par-1 isoform X3 [Octopus sinensis]|uniref:SNF-related serine/threonine-protein kinase n=1 Tax=Octopus sinensis TaxID=2607531 RepID=A0A7E6FHZ2_9MOLL|nr:serine/threonine-protein kinase par-1 isoform X3 [Octopus sinensis]